MGRLPPAERMTLPARKNLRDAWENNRADFEAGLSGMLGTAWTVNIDALQLYAYAAAYNDYAKSSFGDVIQNYIEGALYHIKHLIDRQGDQVLEEINAICFDHSITIDLDVEGSFPYCGCSVSSSGQLVILFAEGQFGTLTLDALELEKLEAALNSAPTPSRIPMSYYARISISKDYQATIEDVRKRLDEILQTEMRLEPCFEETFAKLKADPDSPSGWERNLGSFVKMYMEALTKTLQYLHFGEDDMLREGFVEAVSKATVVFRIVDEGQMRHQSYNECALEDGVLYLQVRFSRANFTLAMCLSQGLTDGLQTAPKYFGTNMDNVADGLMDLL
ncbi:hypothetical protein PT974_01422 [Cladobotryum mycophilum]|uniref:Uncharacterized protein n=1 Tax=Cladobotryum mycophilum TaxID=491253 RepID=A0ABR0T4S3_9HYPO